MFLFDGSVDLSRKTKLISQDFINNSENEKAFQIVNEWIYLQNIAYCAMLNKIYSSLF